VPNSFEILHKKVLPKSFIFWKVFSQSLKADLARACDTDKMRPETPQNCLEITILGST
jgi:hypothetical protein